MKIILSFAAIIVSTLHLSAQDYFPNANTDQEWEYVTWYFWGGACEARRIVIGDVVQKCNTNYTEIWDCNSSKTDCFLIGYYRIQNDSVLIRNNYEYLNGTTDTVVCELPEGLLYDFGMADDSIVNCQSIAIRYPPDYSDFKKTGTLLVDYEGTVRATHEMLYNPHPGSPSIIYNMNWIDGIGSDVHPFYALTCIGDHCEWEQQLTRVYRDGTLIYQDTVLDFSFPCSSWVGNKNQDNKKMNFSIYPNPTSSCFQINSEQISTGVFDILIYNAIGQQVMHLKNHSLNEEISIENLTPGLYFIQLNTEFKTPIMKLILQSS